MKCARDSHGAMYVLSDVCGIPTSDSSGDRDGSSKAEDEDEYDDECYYDETDYADGMGSDTNEKKKQGERQKGEFAWPTTDPDMKANVPMEEVAKPLSFGVYGKCIRFLVFVFA